jgi:membrane associated rhomboid family serine protease
MTITVTLIIILITVGVSLYVSENLSLKHKLLFNPAKVFYSNEWYRMFSHGFIHADLMHLGVNMFVLYFFGQNVEFIFKELFGTGLGSFYFTLMYLGGILFATLPSLFKHKDNLLYSSLGASGAVSAVLFSAILLMPASKVYVFAAIPMPAALFGILYVGYEMYMNKNGKTNIAHDAHLLGALFGVLFTIILSPKFVIYNFIQEIQNIF